MKFYYNFKKLKEGENEKQFLEIMWHDNNFSFRTTKFAILLSGIFYTHNEYCKADYSMNGKSTELSLQIGLYCLYLIHLSRN